MSRREAVRLPVKNVRRIINAPPPHVHHGLTTYGTEEIAIAQSCWMSNFWEFAVDNVYELSYELSVPLAQKQTNISRNVVDTDASIPGSYIGSCQVTLTQLDPMRRQSPAS